MYIIGTRRRYQSALEAYKGLENTVKRAGTQKAIHNQKDKIAEKKAGSHYILAGFRSNTLWKKILAGFFIP